MGTSMSYGLEMGTSMSYGLEMGTSMSYGLEMGTSMTYRLEMGTSMTYGHILPFFHWSLIIVFNKYYYKITENCDIGN